MKLNELKTEVYNRLQVTTTKEVKALYPDRNLRLTESWEAILEELTSVASSGEPSESLDEILEELTPVLGSMEPNGDFPTSVEPTGESFDANVETNATADDIESFPTDWAGIATTLEKYDRLNEQACLECSRANEFGECEVLGDVVSPGDRCDEFVPMDIAEAIQSTQDEPDSTVVTLGMLCVDPEWVENERAFAPVPVALWDFLPGANWVEIFSVEFPRAWVHWIQAICTFVGVHSCGAAMMQGLKQVHQAGLEV